MRRTFAYWRGMTALLLCLLLFAGMLPLKTLAAEGIDPGREASLTVVCGEGEEKFAGVSFSIYKVADVSVDGTYRMTGEFAEYQVTGAVLDRAGWTDFAATLAGYVERDHVEALETGSTGESGTVRFPAQSRMNAGLYLVLGDAFSGSGKVWTPTPFVVQIPALDETGEWLYDVSANVKMESRSENPEGTVRRRVIKVWNGPAQREVEVQLLCDGQVYDTQKLSEENAWTYEWAGLDASRSWRVTEAQVPQGYWVSVTMEGITFRITNTRSRGGGGGGGGSSSSGGGGGTSPGTPGTFTIENGEVPLADLNPDPSEPDTVQIEEGEVPLDFLPQTGMLWWPVPLLAVCGMLLYMAGWRRERKYEEQR